MTEVTMLVPSVGRLGGAETIVRGLTSGLRARGHSVSWLAPRAGVDGAEDARYRLYGGTGLGAGMGLALTGRGVIHSHFAYAAWGWLLAPSRLPVVRTFYGPWHEEASAAGDARRMKALGRQLLEKLSLRRADCVIVLSEYSAGLARSLGCSPSRIHVIPGFVSPNRFPVTTRKLRTRAPARPKGTTVVSNRRLIKRTGVDRLLRAFQGLPDRHAGARLVVIGDGPERRALERLAMDLRISDRVTFTGNVDDRTLSERLAAADLAVVPSIALEGFGLATAEALWHGLPVVVTDSGANPELVRPLAPELIAASAEPRDLCHTITAAIDRLPEWDAGLASNFARERFSLDRFVTQTLLAYQQASTHR